MHPFEIDAMVVPPGHLHAVWTLPVGDADYPTRCALIKAGFSRRLPAHERRSRSRLAKVERGSYSLNCAGTTHAATYAPKPPRRTTWN